jgi:hypothetical protein
MATAQTTLLVELPIGTNTAPISANSTRSELGSIWEDWLRFQPIWEADRLLKCQRYFQDPLSVTQRVNGPLPPQPVRKSAIVNMILTEQPAGEIVNIISTDDSVSPFASVYFTGLRRPSGHW